MHPLLKTLQKVHAEEISPKEASVELEISQGGVTRLAHTWGANAQTVYELLKQLETPQQTAADRRAIIERIADVAGVKPRAARHFAVRLGFIRLPTTLTLRMQQAAEAAATRKNTLREVALKVISGEMTLDRQGLTGGFEYKAVWRKAKELLAREGIPYKDLKAMRAPVREALARRLDDGYVHQPSYPRPKR